MALSRKSKICILPAIGAFLEQGTAPRFSSLCSENVPRLRQGVAPKIYAPARSIQNSETLDSAVSFGISGAIIRAISELYLKICDF